ncbi:hypothetical protein [Aquibacillus salsiterrae]|uniref:Uncharacterized protein n=1 Tax=Aquibacillus salsiterrae TaxID=2950439 RepID=A0A9X4ADW1_9BACI|nr:hypothetical protein [Aquibacillus salsiterrae]MDC3415946.1 hypothetical protein [Aquibacillus salsiterrae]
MMSESNNVISFNDYKRKKFGLDRPIFKEPANIKLGNSKKGEQGTYTVVCNLVYDYRQFIALEREDRPEKLYSLVEGIVENGSLVEVVPITDEEYPKIEAKFKKVFAQVNNKS